MTSVELKPCNPPQGPYTHSTGQEAPGEVLSAVWLPEARGPDWVIPAAPAAAHLPSASAKPLMMMVMKAVRAGMEPGVVSSLKGQATAQNHGRHAQVRPTEGWGGSAQIPALCTTPELPWK